MQSILYCFLLIYLGSALCRIINTKNVSLTTELIPHIEEIRRQITNRNQENNFKKPTDVEDLEEKPLSLNGGTHKRSISSSNIVSTNSRTISTNKNEYRHPKVSDNIKNVSSQHEPVQGSCNQFISSQSYNGSTSMVCPFNPKPSLRRLLTNSYKVLKLSLFPTKFNIPPISFCLSTTSISFVSSLIFILLAPSDLLFDKMRTNWAFQGEIQFGSVENYARFGAAIIAFDFIFRSFILRVAYFTRLFNSNFLSTINWMGNNLSKVDSSIIHKILTGITQSIIATRMLVLTYFQYLMMKNNWNTGSFIIEQEQSKRLSKLCIAILFISVTQVVMDTMFYKTVNSFLGIEHLLEPLEFREKTKKLLLFDYIRELYFNLPKSLRSLVKNKKRWFINLYDIRSMIDSLHPSELEWTITSLHLYMALNSNSAGGIYLASLSIFANLLNGVFVELDKKILIKDNNLYV